MALLVVLSLSFQPKDLDTTIFFEIKNRVQFVIIFFGVSKKGYNSISKRKLVSYNLLWRMMIFLKPELDFLDICHVKLD